MITALLLFTLVLLVCICLLSYLYYKEKRKSIAEQVAFNSLLKVQSVVLSTLDFENVVKQITNIILTDLNYIKMGYAIIVLALLDEDRQALRRVGISQTKEAEAFLRRYPYPFSKIEIPLSAHQNLGVRAIEENREFITNNTADVLYPSVDEIFVSNLQKEVGIKTSVVFPINSRNKRSGVLIFSLKKQAKEITNIEWAVMRNFVGVVGIALENTKLFVELKNSNTALVESNKKLETLDKLKDDFVSVASHELRTPMTAIKSYLWMAINRSDVPLSEKMKKYLNIAYISTERLINLVNDMLNVSRIEAGRIEINPEVLDVQTLAEEAITEVAAKAEERQINVYINKTPIPEVFADSDKVLQVILNLLSNALKFTMPGGSIIISFFTDGKTVEFSVKDSGVGISQEDISHLFQKFGRLNNSYVAAATSGGTGLGLFICKNLIEMMGGKIWVRSEGMGKGSTFTFSLPVATREVIAGVPPKRHRNENEVKYLEPVAI